jgi:hypothetical protein
MRRPLRLLAAAAFIAVCGIAAPRTGQAQNLGSEVPSRAPLIDVPLWYSGAPFEVPGQIALMKSEKEYCLLPAFELREAEIRFGGGPYVPLFGPDGRLNRPLGKDEDIIIRLQVRDLLKSDLRNEVYSNLSHYSDDTRKFDLSQMARFDPQPESLWSASLAVNTPGRVLPLGERLTFSRTQPEHTFEFTVTPYLDPDRQLANPAYDALVGHRKAKDQPRDLEQRVWATDLEFAILGSYRAAVISTDFQVTGRFMDESLADIVNQVVSTPSGDPRADLFVPVGSLDGAISHDFGIRKAFQQAMSFQILRNSSSNADPAILNKFFDRTFDLFQNKINFIEAARDKTICFLTETGAQVTTPFNKISQMSDAIQHMSKDQLDTLLQQMDSSDKTQDIGVGASASFLGIGGSADVNSHYNNKLEHEREEIRNAFKENMEDAKRMVAGEIQTVPALSLSEAKQIREKHIFEAMLNQATFTVLPRPYQSNLSFDRFVWDPDTDIGVGLEFRRSLYGIIKASYDQFQPILGEEGSDYYWSTIQLPDGQGGLFTTIIRLGGSQQFLQALTYVPDRLKQQRLYSKLVRDIGAVLKAISPGWTSDRRGQTWGEVTFFRNWDPDSGNQAPRVEVDMDETQNSNGYLVGIYVELPR